MLPFVLLLLTQVISTPETTVDPSPDNVPILEMTIDSCGSVSELLSIPELQDGPLTISPQLPSGVESVDLL